MTTSDAERALVELLSMPAATRPSKQLKDARVVQIYGLLRAVPPEVAAHLLPLIRVGGPQYSRFTSLVGSDRLRLEEILTKKLLTSGAYALDSRGIGSRGISIDLGSRGLAAYGSRGVGDVERGLVAPSLPSASTHGPAKGFLGEAEPPGDPSARPGRGLRNVHSMPWIGRIHNAWSAALRRQPGKDPSRPHGGIGADLPAGTVVRVVNRDRNWLYVEVEIDGKRLDGYVSEELVEFEREDVAEPPKKRRTPRQRRGPDRPPPAPDRKWFDIAMARLFQVVPDDYAGKRSNQLVAETEFEDLSDALWNIGQGIGGLKLTGDDADRTSFLMLVVETTRSSPSLRELVIEIGHDHDPSRQFGYEVGRRQPGVIVDSFIDRMIDMDDIETFAETPSARHPDEITRGELIVHMLAESRHAVLHGLAFDLDGFEEAHPIGTAEGNVYREERGQIPVIDQLGERRPNGSMGVDFVLSNGKRHRLEVDPSGKITHYRKP